MFQQPYQELVSRFRIDLDLPAVQAQEGVRAEERDPLIAIDKGVIHEERFKKSGRHLDQVPVVSRLRPE